MPRISAVTPKTYEELLFDAGVVFENLDYSTVDPESPTAASDLFAIVKPAIPTEACLGASRGAINWSSAAEYREVELDDVFVTVKGATQKEKITVTVSMTLTQFSPENARRLINASDLTSEGNVTTLKERTYIDVAKDYIDHLVIVVRQGVGNVAVIDMQDAINTAAGAIQTNSQGEAEMAVTWTATISDPEDSHAPYSIKWFKNSTIAS